MFGLPAVVGAVHGNLDGLPRRAVEPAGDLDAQAGVAPSAYGSDAVGERVPEPQLVGMEEASGAAGFGGLVAHVEARLDHGECAPGTRAVAWRRLEEGDRFVPPGGVGRRYFFAASK